jgi:hypothetical protein
MSANIKASTDGTQAIIGVGGVDQMTVSNAGVVTANSFVGNVTGGTLSGNASSATALATGSTTARTLANRFADVVNVLDYGAFNNGSNASATTTAIQAAINANPGKAIYFPSGIYWINDVLRISQNYTSLVADAVGATMIVVKDFTKSAAIEIKSNTSGGNVFGVNISNIDIERGASSNYQIGIIAERCDQLRIADCMFEGIPTAIDLRGCRGVFGSNLKLGAFGSTAYSAGEATLKIGATSYGGNYDGFTTLFTNCVFQTVGLDHAVSIRGTDYNTFSNCYFGPGKISGLLIEGTFPPSAAGNFNNNFDNCYFDRGSFAEGDPGVAGALLSDAGLGASVNTKFTDCIFTTWDVGIKINKPSVGSYDPSNEITGCKFILCRNSAIYVNSNSTSLVISGNQFFNPSYNLASSAAIDVVDLSQVTITGNCFQYNSSVTYVGNRNAIRLAGSINSVSITGNAITTFAGANVTDFANTATITSLSVNGNASNNTTNTIVGNIIGNQVNTDPLSLNWYQEGVFTPVLSFNSGSTGITFSERQGNFTRIGNRVVFDIYIVLTSKGTSTGAVGIGGIPFPLAPSATARANASVSIQRIDGIGTANVDAVFPSTAGMKLVYINGTGDPVDLTDANFRNNTQFWISGTYQAE